MLRSEHPGQIERIEHVVRHCGHDRLEPFAFGQKIGNFDTVFALYDFGRRPGVVDRDTNAVLAQRAVNVDHFCISHIGAVFLEGETEDKDVRTKHLNSLLQHQLNHLLGDVLSHSVVHAPSGKDNLRVIAVALCALRQIVGVHADAVSAHQSRLERQEIPFRRSGFQHILRVDAHPCKDLRQLVHKGDVDVALRVFNHLCRFGHLDRRGQMRTGRNDRSIHVIHKLANFRRRARSHLFNPLNRMFLIAWIDALRRITGKKVFVEFQPGDLFNHRNALILRNTRIDGRFVNHDIAFRNHLPDRRTCPVEGCQVRIVVPIDRSGNRHHIKIAISDIINI